MFETGAVVLAYSGSSWESTSSFGTLKLYTVKEERSLSVLQSLVDTLERSQCGENEVALI